MFAWKLVSITVLTHNVFDNILIYDARINATIVMLASLYLISAGSRRQPISLSIFLSWTRDNTSLPEWIPHYQYKEKMGEKNYVA